MPICGFQYGRVAFQLLEKAAQRLSDQEVIIDHKDFHRALSFRLTVLGSRGTGV
jgi:hypothetical protein